MPLALAGSLTAVQFRYPAELPLALDPAKGGKHFPKVSKKQRLGYGYFDLLRRNIPLAEKG